jgi:hypothetical protein
LDGEAISVQRLKSAHRSSRSLLVVRFFKYQGQTDHALKVNGLSCFDMNSLFIFVDRKGHIIMANDAFYRQNLDPSLTVIDDFF